MSVSHQFNVFFLSQMDQDQMINDSLRTIAETEEIGGVIIGELQRNSETIKSSHNKVSFSSLMASICTWRIVCGVVIRSLGTVGRYTCGEEHIFQFSFERPLCVCACACVCER